jgi:hypothetical protein
MNRLLKPITLAVALATTSIACTQEIPTGHIGRCRTPSGFSDDLNGPGRVSCFNRDRLYLLEVSDKQVTIKMNVLCADRLNFSFDVGVLAAVDKQNTSAIKDAFENVTPDNGSTISADQLIKMYVAPVVDQEARKVVSTYTTDQIVDKRPEIIEKIRAAVKEALNASLVEVKRITVNNLDFPKVVTEAQEKRAQKQVEIETEKAEQRKRLIKAQNELKISEAEYKRDLVEAAKIADANKIIGASLTPGYLAWWQLKVLSEAAQGPNNWGFIPYSDMVNGSASKWTSSQGIVDAELIKRIQTAREEANQGQDTETPAPSTPTVPKPGK